MALTLTMTIHSVLRLNGLKKEEQVIKTKIRLFGLFQPVGGLTSLSEPCLEDEITFSHTALSGPQTQTLCVCALGSPVSALCKDLVDFL